MKSFQVITRETLHLYVEGIGESVTERGRNDSCIGWACADHCIDDGKERYTIPYEIGGRLSIHIIMSMAKVYFAYVELACYECHS